MPAEAPEDALRRELQEELGLAASVGDLIETVTWTYPEKTVRILFFRCTALGEPCPQERQEMRWVEAAELPRYPFPPPISGSSSTSPAPDSLLDGNAPARIGYAGA